MLLSPFGPNAGYLTSESDPQFSASAASGITSANISNWSTSYGWGNHPGAGYLSTESDPKVGANTANRTPGGTALRW